MELTNENSRQISDSILAGLIKPTTDVTLKYAGDEYSAFVLHNRSPKTYKCVQTFLNHVYSYFSIERKAGTISPRDAEKFLFYLKKKAPKGYRNYHRIARAFFNTLIRWGYLHENVFAKISLPKKQREMPSFLDENEMRKVWEKLDEIGKTTISNIVIVGFYTGMRIGEIVNLRWGNINLEERIIIVGDTKFTTKNRKSRPIPMNGVVFSLLSELDKGRRQKSGERSQEERRQKAKDYFVFGKTNTHPFTVDYVSKSFKKVCRALGIDESIHAHSIRHSGASHLVRKGSNLYAIKEILGHQSISTTEIYSHLRLDDLRKAVGE